MDKKIPYLIVGGGRVAAHFAAYFDLLGVEYLRWNRTGSTELKSQAEKCDKILLAVKDDSLEEFISKLITEFPTGKTIIHFSGALEIKGAESVHPLMTFADKIYTLDEYKRIPFVTVENKAHFKELFPELPNPSYEIPSDKKTLYHALLTVAGNFPVILWKSVSSYLEKETGLPKKVMQPYLRKTLDNFFYSEDSLTGPFARKDIGTIEKHLDSLRDSELLNIYKAFKNFHFGGETK